MNFRCPLLASLILAPLFASAQANPVSSNPEPFAEVLQPVGAEAPKDARALWLDGRTIRWNAPAGAVRIRLLGSNTAGLRAVLGEKPGGASQMLTLSAVPTPNLPDLARFSHVQGTAWRVAEADPQALTTLWQGQLLIVGEDAEGRVLAATGTQLAGALDDAYAQAATRLEFGARVDGGATTFALWAPTARAVSLCLYDQATSPASSVRPMQWDASSGAWHLTLPEDLRGKFYQYAVEVFVRGVGWVRNRVTDPYSRSLGGDSARTAVVDLDDAGTRPAGWPSDQHPATVHAATDLVVYELHVRDFSRDDLTVPAPFRGKYLAFAERESDGMKHLRRLARAGVTDIHLLPVFDFASVPERHPATPVLPNGTPSDSPAIQAAMAAYREADAFNWGYDPWHYLAPEGSYATNPDDAVARVLEFRTMVQSLHAAGLRVGMDVVYNHTMADGQDARAVLDRIVPGYYHRLDGSGKVEASTCNSNTATENAMMAKLVVDASLVWARDYHIDSFRFDLMGHLPRALLERLQGQVDAATGRHINLLGEGWNFGEVQNGARFVQASQLSLQHSGIGTFSDRMRDGVRGGSAGDSGEGLHVQGWLNGLHYAPNSANVGRDQARQLAAAADLVRVGLAGTLSSYRMQGADGRIRPLAEFAYGDQSAGYAAEPSEVVNYIENHDNQTLFDNNALRLPAETSRTERARVQVAGNALVLFSQGIAYLHAGQEIMRSKSLDRNSFNSGDIFNRIDWTLGTNHFGVGLPPAGDNESSWTQMRTLLARAAELAPAPDDIRYCWEATLRLLAVRQSSTLFRLRTAADVAARLHFLNTGPQSNPSAVVGHLDGRGYPGAGFAEVLYVVNADVAARTLALPTEAGKPWKLHPALSPQIDPRLLEYRLDSAAGTLTVPPRTALVLVLQE